MAWVQAKAEHSKLPKQGAQQAGDSGAVRQDTDV